MKRVLVTGASGQLGMSIQDIQNEFQNLEFVFKGRSELDITNNNQVKDVFGFENFDYCINCAAYTDVEQAEKTPEVAYIVNSDGVINLAMACKDKNVTLVHISTDYVFDGEKETPYTIDDTPNPINEYGKSKWEGEKHVQEILDHYFIVRTSWLYHKKYGRNFYKTILEKAKRGEIIKVTDAQVGCPTNAVTLANFIVSLLSNLDPNYGIVHYTDCKTMTWYDFAKKIVEENNLRSTTTVVKDDKYRSFVQRPSNSRLT